MDSQYRGSDDPLIRFLAEPCSYERIRAVYGAHHDAGHEDHFYRDKTDESGLYTEKIKQSA